MIGRPVKISVIIPVYNVEHFLSYCLGSCVRQTLNDVEFICVNDGSTDNSLVVLKEFAKRDHRIKIIDKPNGGVSSARNAGLDAAQGEFIMFLDADDSLEEKACERVWCESLEAPTDIVIFSSKVFPKKPKPDDWYYYVLTCPTRRYWEFSPQVLFGEPSTRPFIWHQAFRKKLFDDNNIRFDENVRQGEDMIFLMQIYPFANYFAFIQDHLYNYRWYREGSAMWNFNIAAHKAGGNMDARVEQHLYVADVVCKYWKEHGWADKYGVDLLGWALQFVSSDIHELDISDVSKYEKELKALVHKYDLQQYVNDVEPHLKAYAKKVK